MLRFRGMKKIGDDKIFILSMDFVQCIPTGETGENAV